MITGVAEVVINYSDLKTFFTILSSISFKRRKKKKKKLLINLADFLFPLNKK